MARLSSVTRQGRTNMVIRGLALLLMMFLCACGDGSDSGDISIDGSQSETETGAAVLKINWHDASTIKGDVGSLAEEVIDCEDVGVETITCKVYDESNTLLATGDPWPCSEHSGSLDGIPVGQNRIFVILGEDDEGNIMFQGQKPNITIDRRPDNDVGTIEAHAFVPEGLAATTNPDLALQIDLVWTEPNATISPAGYRIYRDGVLVGTSASLSYSDTGLVQETEYCYTISAYDDYGNVSGPSIQVCARTGVPIDADPPTVPTGLSARASSASQIGLEWTVSSDNVGVTEYRIFRDGNQVGTSASPSYSDTGLIQNTRYCYTVEAYDAADNGSGQSNPDCATTLESFDWYRDSDNDTYGDPNDSVISETRPEGYVSDYTDCNDDNPSIHPGATESCNGNDDNCDGSIDEDLTRPTTCGVGACADNTGTETCTAGVWGNDTCDPLDGAISERCDNVDNDCDGSVDEDLTQSTTCGVGACADNTGTETCSAGVWGNDTCDPLDGATLERCDNVDNDCDGSVDEGLTRSTACGVGACAGNTGTETCTAGDWGNDTCDPLDGAMSEWCDNVDNDCDGAVDENLTRQTTCGVGACEGNTGIETCTAGDWGNDTCNPTAGASREICFDAIDNNCDGLTDEYCPIEVDIDYDFDYVAQGSPMGLAVGETAAAGRLRTYPYEELREPPYYDLYGEFYSTYYGYLRLGNSNDAVVSFVLVYVGGDEVPSEMFFDRNNNEDLTDDGGPISNQGTGGFGALVPSVNVRVVTSLHGTITRLYRLWMWLRDGQVWFYARCHYLGELTIGADSFSAVAFEVYNHDVLYQESGLYIDLNRNNQLTDSENFMDGDTVTINNIDYELRLNYP